jgi:hypothetical protein
MLSKMVMLSNLRLAVKSYLKNQLFITIMESLNPQYEMPTMDERVQIFFDDELKFTRNFCETNAGTWGLEKDKSSIPNRYYYLLNSKKFGAHRIQNDGTKTFLNYSQKEALDFIKIQSSVR